MRTVGTQARGIRTPIVKEGDNLVETVVSSLKKSWESEDYQLRDRDVIGITESLLARAQGNYVNINDIAEEIKEKFPNEIGLIFPILSRNRFSMILKAIARSGRKIYLQLSYPSDEVGNHLMDIEQLDELNINPSTDVLSEKDYYKYFSDFKHPFTGLDYIQLYKNIAEETEIEIILANKPESILEYTKDVLVADIHTRSRSKNILKKAGANIIYGLDDLCTVDNGHGFNPEYGLLGSNTASENSIKLFPKDGKKFVNQVQQRIKELTGKKVEVMIYGDGAFKDPVGKIWELADPVVSPAYTAGLEGTPNEVKLKYLADNKLEDLKGEALLEAMKKEINENKSQSSDDKALGTTPRQLTDLLGSLCDLISGSGDKGTPVVLIQGYFDNLAND
ncbi:coenzyme F420-0:L-glutamate ligase [Natronospora cellulosivora (SeqCode)]